MSSGPTADEEVLAVPGVLSVAPGPSGKWVVRVGPAAGWMVPKGIMGWTHEISFVLRADAPAVAVATRATQAHEQIAPKKYPMAKRASEASPLVPLSANLVAAARSAGARVHTVGVDRVSAEFYYLADGGSKDPVRVQGNLVEMLTPSLGLSADNDEIHRHLSGLIDRLLTETSGGLFGELELELANALPRMSRDGTGLEGTQLDAFDARARSLSIESAHLDQAARELVDALRVAADRGRMTARVPLYGEAVRESRAPLQVQLGGRLVKLPAQLLWTVTGAPREEVKGTASPEPPKAARSPAAVPAPHAAATPIAPAAVATPATPRVASPRPRPVAAVSGAVPRPAASPSPAPAVAALPVSPPALSESVPAPAEVTPAPPVPTPVPEPEAPTPAVVVTPVVSISAPEAPIVQTSEAMLTPSPVVVRETYRERTPTPAPIPVEEPAPSPAVQTPEGPPAQPSPEKPVATPTKSRVERTEIEGKDRKEKGKAASPAPKSSSSSWVWILVLLVAAAAGAFVFWRRHHH